MAVLSCARSWQGIGGSLDTDGRKASANFQELYQVIHDATDNLVAIINGASSIGPNPLPRSGDLFDGTDSVFVTSIRPQAIGPIMTAFLVSYQGETGPGGFTNSADEIKAEYRIRSKVTQAEVDEDWEGRAIVTANDEPINGITRDIVDNVLTVKRKFITASAQLSALYAQSTNSDSFSVPGYTDVWQPGQAKLVEYDLASSYGEIGSSLVEVTATIELRTPYRTTPDKAWYARVRHQGFVVKVDKGSLTFKVYATDDNKERVTTPVLLDADGYRVESVEDATWLEFQLYGELPYSLLGLW
jgi:hypothetical protein